MVVANLVVNYQFKSGTWWKRTVNLAARISSTVEHGHSFVT